jgi:hypothetical protein
MDLLRLLAEPRKLLGGLTIALSAVAGLWVFGQSDGQLPAATLLLLPVVVMSVLAWQQERAFRGWLYLMVAWGFGFVAYGALAGVG